MTSFSPLGPKSQTGSAKRNFAVFFNLTAGGLPRRFIYENSSGTVAGGIFPTSSSLVPPGLFLPLVVLSDPEGVLLTNRGSLATMGVPFYATSGHVVCSES